MKNSCKLFVVMGFVAMTSWAMENVSIKQNLPLMFPPKNVIKSYIENIHKQSGELLNTFNSNFVKHGWDSPELKLNPFVIQQDLLAYFRILIPTIQLFGVNSSETKQLRYNGTATCIEPKLSINTIYPKDSEISAVNISIEDKNPKYILVELKNRFKKNDTITEHVQTDIIQLQEKATALAFNKDKNFIYVGSEKGYIEVYDLNKEIKNQINTGLNLPIQSLHLFGNAKYLLVSLANKTLMIWNLEKELNQPLVYIKNEHEKSFITESENSIIQSHGFRSSVTKMWDEDALFEMPKDWLGQSATGAITKQDLYMHLLYSLDQDLIKENPATFIKNLYCASVKNTFEPSVTKAITMYLESKWKSFGFSEKDLILPL